MYKITLENLMKEFEINNLTPEINLETVEITHQEINRPALQIAGYFDYFDSHMLQVIGKVEHTFLSKLGPSERKEVINKLFDYKIPALVFCRGLAPYDEMFDASKRTNTPLLSTPLATNDFISEIIRFLKVELAPRITVHGTFVDVFGEGVLIMGDSGIGKSETALELIKRGHRLIADDAVEIRKVSNHTLYGTSPEIIRHFIELRGIGIIDVREMFGVSSIKKTQVVDLVIKLKDWDNTEDYDRLGINDIYHNILGNDVVMNCIPIRPGRNLAIIIEAAAINNRQKSMGYNAAAELNRRVMENLSKNSSK